MKKKVVEPEVVEEKKEDIKEDKALVVTDSRAMIFKQLEEQYNLPIKDVVQLIRSEAPLTEVGAKLALRVAQSFGLPLQGINVITTSRGVTNVYVNADGIRWRVHTDDRGIAASTGEITHRPTKDEPWFEAVGTVKFKDGSEFTNIGVVGVNLNNSMEVANGAMKAITKAKRRAGVDAVGVALPIAEDFLEYAEEQRSRGKSSGVIDGEFQEIASKSITEPTNLAEVLAWVQQHNKSIDEATGIAGDLAVIASDVKSAVAKLREAWETKQ